MENTVVTDCINEEEIKIFTDAYNKVLLDKKQKEYVQVISNLINNSNLQYFSLVPNIKVYLQKLLNKKMLYAYKITLMIYLKSEMLNKIVEQTPVSRICMKDPYIYVSQISTKVKHYLEFIDAFKYVPMSIASMKEQLSENNNVDLKYEKIWYDETRIEIINRLAQVSYFFSQNKIIIKNIKKISSTNADQMTYNELAYYYNQTIEKIKNSLDQCSRLCNLFMDIQINYLLALTTSECNLSIKNINMGVDI